MSRPRPAAGLTAVLTDFVPVRAVARAALFPICMTEPNRARKNRQRAAVAAPDQRPANRRGTLALRPLVFAVAGVWTATSAAQSAGTAQATAPAVTPASSVTALATSGPTTPGGSPLVPKMAEPVQRPDNTVPTFTAADRMDGRTNEDIHLRGNGELRRNGSVLKGDTLDYNQDTDVATATGNVRLFKGGTLVTGPDAKLKVTANEGTISTPTYEFHSTGGHGTAERIDFIDKDNSRITRGTYTTCSPDNVDWYFSASRIDIDSDRQVGTGRNGVLHFFGVPVFAAPVMDFPLNDDRRSGFLAPVFGYNSRSGADVTLPYYFNIAPNRDLTLYPRLLSQRGLQLGAEYRYLDASYSGVLRGEFLPDDREAGRNRWSISAVHTQRLAPGLTGYINYNKVSDNTYPDDLGRSIVTATQRQYTQEGGVTYSIGDWVAQARVQKFQTLSTATTPLSAPYERLPQLSLTYNRYDVGGFDVNFVTDYTRFSIPTANTVQGERLFMQPTISYPIVRPGWYVTPKFILNTTAYRLDRPAGDTQDTQINRTLPTFSLDSGMTFERDAPLVSKLFGVSYIQTLEPRVFYVYTPYRDQSQIPLFDTGQSDYNLGQIFTENPYTGYDRIADNNKVTAGVTTRFIEAESGIERLRATIAQRIDLDGQRVTLAGAAPTSVRRYSDLLGATTIQMFRGIFFDTNLQYNQDIDRIMRSTVAFSWKPEANKVINLGYRYYRQDANTGQLPLEQADISTQWPITRRLYGLGRIGYDLDARKPSDMLLGLEYVADCWVGRLAVQRYSNAVSGYTTHIFAQIEFKGLSKVGNNPIDVIRLNVPGYQPVTAQPITPSVLDQYE
ncbi:LPS-assembly protein LptD [Ralstonia sp. LMG 32965]|uniref:LPS-assembly protein LptD n=2 Tax=Ralstonia flatus TaxID=3058601 RepID=A0AAD2F566_9RALS|nr:LPS-assembly protein LptD [Ralstonia sp. LMG 32965]CAJ0883363.1 LPS-assembly protein LptD [Ralstonia sp. LMG 32965]